MLSNLVPSWWKLIGGDLKRCDTGKEKSMGEMNLIPADICETSCDSF